MDPQRLIAAIVAAPDDPAPWLEYADWLLDRGDKRGELIHLDFASTSNSSMNLRVRDLESNEALMLSPALAAQAQYWHLDYFRGFIHDARLVHHESDAPWTPEAISALAQDPHAILLARLHLTSGDEYSDQCDHLTGVPLPNLSPEIRDLGDISRDLNSFPRLDELELKNIACPYLRHATLRVLHANARACRALVDGGFDLPQLQLLHWDVDTEPANPAALLRRPPPKLREVCLHAHDTTRDEAERIRAEFARLLPKVSVDVAGVEHLRHDRDHHDQHEH